MRDEAREQAHRKGTTAEPEQIDAITGVPVAQEKGVKLAHIRLRPRPQP